MPQMNFDLEDGEPPVSFPLNQANCVRFVAFMRECEDGKNNARRYQLLRRGQQWSVIDGIGDTLRGDALDVALDAELTAPTDPYQRTE